MKMKLMIVLLCVGILNAAGCEYHNDEMSNAQLETIQKRLEASQTVPAAQPEGGTTDEAIQPEGEDADAAAAPERLLGPKSPCTDHSQCESGWCGEARRKEDGEIRRICFTKKPLAKKWQQQYQARAEEPPVPARRADEAEEPAECTAEQTVEITRIKQDVMNLREWILARGGSVQEPEPANDDPQTCEDDIQFLKEWAFSLRRQLIQEQGAVVPANEAEARPVPAASLSAVWHDAGVVGNYSSGIRNDNDLRGAMPGVDAGAPQHEFYPRGSL